MSSRTSRRVILGGFAASVLVALDLPLDETTLLAKKNKGKGKKKNKKKVCPRPGDSPLSQNACGPDCTNYLIDDDNCGGCATTGRPPGLICIPGRTTCVEGQCVEGDIDSRNCRELAGGAGCPPQTVCCKEPIGQGEPQVYALHCRNLKQDTNHCGTCNHACTEGKQPACCFGRCRDLHADPLNCGACVNRCPKTKSLCSAGQCRQTCPQGLTRCGNTCLHQPTEICCNGRVIAKDDLQFDAENCGDCGYDCSTLATAKGGCCGGECCDVNNPSCCSGQCTNVSLNEEHCGECGNACGPNSYCRFGVCTCPVPPCP